MSCVIGRFVMYERPRSPLSDARRRSGRTRCGSGSSRRSSCAQPGDRRAVGALADHRLDRIAGRDVEQQERDDEHAEQRRDREEQAAEDERASWRTCVGLDRRRRSSAGR